jgi:hypothetical protein
MVRKKLLFADSCPPEAVVWSASTFCCPNGKPPGTLNVTLKVPSEATDVVASGILAKEILTVEQPDAVLQNPEPLTLTVVPSGPWPGVSVIDGDEACTAVAARRIAAFPARNAAAAVALDRRLTYSKRTEWAQGNLPPTR